MTHHESTVIYLSSTTADGLFIIKVEKSFWKLIRASISSKSLPKNRLVRADESFQRIPNDGEPRRGVYVLAMQKLFLILTPLVGIQ